MIGVVAAVLASLPAVLLRLVAPVLTEELMLVVMRRLLIAAMRKAASLTESTLDDQIVEDVIARLTAQPPQAAANE